MSGRERPEKPKVYVYKEWVCPECSKTWPWKPRRAGGKRPKHNCLSKLEDR